MTPADAVFIAVRTAGLVAVFQAAGIAIFGALFLQQLTPGSLQALRAMARRSASAALALLLLHFALEPARMGGSFASVLDPSLHAMALHSQLAAALAWKCGGVLLIAAGLARDSRVGMGVAALGAASACLGFTQTGHIASTAPHRVLQLLLWIHLMIGAFWFGALLPLILIARRDSAADAWAVVARFSSIAGSLVPLVAVAGIAMAALLLGDLARLWTPYGRLILCKAVLFACLMGLATLNRYRLAPALLRGGSAGARRFTQVVQLECLLLAAALLTTAVLTTLYSPDP